MSLDLAQVREQFARNRPKAFVLLALSLVLVVLIIRVVIQSLPRSAAASLQPVPANPGPALDAKAQADMEERLRVSQRLWKTLREHRGLPASAAFAFDPSYYSLDPNHRALTEPVAVADNAPRPTATAPAAEPAPAPATGASLQQQLAKLQLRSIVMRGSTPLAVINSQIVHVGDKVDEFRVVAIQDRKVWLEKDGRKVPLQMSQSDQDRALERPN